MKNLRPSQVGTDRLFRRNKFYTEIKTSTTSGTYAMDDCDTGKTSLCLFPLEEDGISGSLTFQLRTNYLIVISSVGKVYLGIAMATGGGLKCHDRGFLRGCEFCRLLHSPVKVSEMAEA